MSVSRGLMLSALFAMASNVLLPTSSPAQHYEAARRSLDLAPDPITRSPRLLGMGRLTLADDPYNGLTMWDFAGNPTGVLDADSVSAFDLRPGTSASSGRHSPIGYGYERQVVATRELRLGYEAWRRAEGQAYGFVGSAATLRTDRTFNDDTGLRATYTEPNALGVLNGRIPFFQPDRTRYALAFFYSSENEVDEYRTLYANGTGQYLGREGDILATPDMFTPDEYRISTLGAGLGLSYRLAPWSTTAVVVGGKSSQFSGENSSVIHDSGTTEDRPYYTIQATEMGHLEGTPLEWIYDVRTWKSASEARWVFSLKAGLNQDPFVGRGKLLDREESGIAGRGRLRCTLGRLVLAGSFDHGTRSVEITPPALDDLTSFNYFRNTAWWRDGADSLALPDSVFHGKSEDTYWGAAGGGTWKLSKGTLGVEYHYVEHKLIQETAGEGPKRRIWDVRTGLEYPCTGVMTGRLGYLYRDDDRDLLTENNEYGSQSVTAGLGLAPPGSMWGLDIGYLFEWIQPGFDPADDPKETRHQMAAQIHWAF